jgi:hypothetical protein
MFGISFGKSGQSTTTSTDSTTSGWQNQQGQNTNTTTGNSSTTGSSSSTGSSTTSGSTNGWGSQSNSGTAFDAATLAAIGGNIGAFIDRIMGGGAGKDAIAQLGTFDAQSFIDNTMKSALSQATDQFEQGVNSISSNVGGSANENSAAALLANRLENATNSSLAGTRASAEQAAQGIQVQRAGAVAAASQGEQNALAQILNAIKGGVTSSNQTNQQGQNTNQSTNTSENTNTSQNTNSTQTALEIINQLLNSQQHTTGTETSDTSKSGGGLSLSL